MKDEYEQRYGVPFHEVIGPVVDRASCEAAPAIVACPDGAITVLYAGSLQMDRWHAAIDMANAVAALRQEGTNIRFVCYNLDAPAAAMTELEQLGTLLKAPVPVAEMPGILKGADILFLPESFEQNIGTWIALSLSSKVPYYIMAKRPIVVYGSPCSGVVRHAKTEGWAIAVTEPGVDGLLTSLRRIIAAGFNCLHEDAVFTGYDAKQAQARMCDRLLGLCSRAESH